MSTAKYGKENLMAVPLELAPIEERDTAWTLDYALWDRRKLLAEVKRLRGEPVDKFAALVGPEGVREYVEEQRERRRRIARRRRRNGQRSHLNDWYASFTGIDKKHRL